MGALASGSIFMFVYHFASEAARKMMTKVDFYAEAKFLNTTQ